MLGIINFDIDKLFHLESNLSPISSSGVNHYFYYNNYYLEIIQDKHYVNILKLKYYKLNTDYITSEVFNTEVNYKEISKDLQDFTNYLNTLKITDILADIPHNLERDVLVKMLDKLCNKKYKKYFVIQRKEKIKKLLEL